MKTSDLESTVKRNLEQVKERIESAACAANRDPRTIRLVVVTKGHTIERVEAAIAAGARYLGENYVEEALDKIIPLSGQFAVEWHMIGHVQSRKARPVCENFDFVHSLDSVKLAGRLDRFAAESNRRLPVLLECNVSGEESKHGFPAWDPTQWQSLVDQASQVALLPHLDVRGLMTMAPYFDDPEMARPYFFRLARVREYLFEKLLQVDWTELSMGMSADFEVAIQEGATIVRIGQAILGPRPD